MDCFHCNGVAVIGAPPCAFCGLWVGKAEPKGTLVVKQPDAAKAHVAASRAHGFTRLAQELDDPQMTTLCEKGAIDVPLEHPVEKAAEAIADAIGFVKTPGGKSAFEAIKKGLSSLFGG